MRQWDSPSVDTFSPCLNSSLDRLRLLSVSQILNRSTILSLCDSMKFTTISRGFRVDRPKKKFRLE